MSQDKDYNYQIAIGGSTILPGYSTTLTALEIHYNYDKPHQIDYLSNLERESEGGLGSLHTICIDLSPGHDE